MISPARSGQEANTRGLSSGTPPRSALRRWWATNAIASGTAEPSAIQDQAGQPSCRPSTSGSTIATRHAVIRATPARSNRERWSARDSGTRRRQASSAATPSGTLIQKIARQPIPARSARMRMPPMSCPETAARPITIPYTLIARTRAGPL